MTPRPEIAALLHERRFTRYLRLSRDVPRVKGRCAWCGGPGRRGLKYCSEACVDEANIRASGTVVQSMVFRRDQGVCAACGIDCHYIKTTAARLCLYPFGGRAWGVFNPWNNRGQWGSWATTSHQYWQADHIIPVAEGGGVCGLDNYRTLCLRCHKLDTAELAGRLADERKGQGRLL